MKTAPTARSTGPCAVWAWGSHGARGTGTGSGVGPVVGVGVGRGVGGVGVGVGVAWGMRDAGMGLLASSIWHLAWGRMGPHGAAWGWHGTWGRMGPHGPHHWGRMGINLQDRRGREGR
jgi:hypothetical protein